MSFFARLKLALSILFGGTPPAQALPAPTPKLEPVALPPPPAPPAPDRQHASALFLLGLLQREGRLIDFLQEDVSGFSDADVGAAARLVHEKCRKVLTQYLPVTPVVNQSEGDAVEIPTGFDANRFRLAGNVTGAGPWKGSLKHHGWTVTKVQLPDVPTSVELKVLAAAEVELP